ncbi:hypothetical protein GXW82_33690 [Streptacidiphilus sp. 4-A2]|nr:hypothetical protein [Streptacidiphilus sp. 4-A2]
MPLLEELLGLPEHALSRRLGSPRPRGRWAVKQPPAEARRLDELWPDDPWLLDVLEELEAPPAESLERLSIHDDYHVDARSGQYLLRVRQVVRATTDRVSRCIVGFKSNEAGDDPAVFNLVRHARVGRIRHRPDSAFVLAELVLDTPLNTGDTAVFDYELLMSNAQPATSCDRRFTTPAREYVLQVHFDPARGARPLLPLRARLRRRAGPRAQPPVDRLLRQRPPGRPGRPAGRGGHPLGMDLIHRADDRPGRRRDGGGCHPAAAVSPL